MNATHLFPTLATCRALEEAGFPQATVFVWAKGLGPTPRATLRGSNTEWGPCEGSAAPTLSEVLAHLPVQLAFAVPHPIYGSLERAHTLEVGLGGQARIGYHLVGSHEVQHRIEHESAVEAAAHLYLALRSAGRLRPPSASEAPPRAGRSAKGGERLAHAA